MSPKPGTSGLATFRETARKSRTPAPWCLEKGCINANSAQRSRINELAAGLSWSPTDRSVWRGCVAAWWWGRRRGWRGLLPVCMSAGLSVGVFPPLPCFPLFWARVVVCFFGLQTAAACDSTITGSGTRRALATNLPQVTHRYSRIVPRAHSRWMRMRSCPFCACALVPFASPSPPAPPSLPRTPDAPSNTHQRGENGRQVLLAALHVPATRMR